MPKTLDEVSAAALELSLEDRASLAERLEASLLSPEWLKVAEQRSAEIATGTAKLIPGDESLARARAAVADVRKAARRRCGADRGRELA